MVVLLDNLTDYSLGHWMENLLEYLLDFLSGNLLGIKSDNLLDNVLDSLLDSRNRSNQKMLHPNIAKDLYPQYLSPMHMTQNMRFHHLYNTQLACRNSPHSIHR